MLDWEDDLPPRKRLTLYAIVIFIGGFAWGVALTALFMSTQGH